MNITASGHIRNLAQVFTRLKNVGLEYPYTEHLITIKYVAQYLLAVIKPEKMDEYVKRFEWITFNQEGKDYGSITVEHVLCCKIDWILDELKCLTAADRKILLAIQKFIEKGGSDEN